MSKVVYVAMSADILHNGHLNIINKASAYGEVVIGLLTDKAIASYKRVPFMNYQQRFEVVSNIKNVKNVIPQETLDYSSNLLKLKPDIVVHGDDWREGVQAKTRSKVIETLKGFISSEYNNIHKIFDKKIIEYRKLLYGLYEMKRFKIGSEIVKAKIIDISVNGELVLNINNKQKSFSHGSLSLLTE